MSEYVGRFAPSPTGPLHFGSVIAALGSRLEARRAGGRWLLRIDDIDPPRQQPGAIDHILRQLEALGLEWDGPVIYQGERQDAYHEALARLRRDGQVYCCTCSRKALARTAARGPLGPVYPGTCRDRPPAGIDDAALRLRLPPGRIALADRGQGEYALDTAREMGDPVVRRRDGLVAYHLATTIDDAALGVTDVVRGADLLPSALVQQALQAALALPALGWRHLPLAVAADGDKLSKQTGAAPVDPAAPLPALLAAWRFLGQADPPEPPTEVSEFHRFALESWDPDRIPAGPLPAPAA
ncbi:MAG: tRNA glutamyl-Q(34) synthetase GluQRS [Halofilum sp. (in: g-proteobacteria)]|nr:tRNA glutamyl-Q(34) synthetase GluQRS [Halofilum sp. (in: g-proteobacteria)]